MRRCYQFAIVVLVLALATSAFAVEYLDVSAKGAPAGDCLGLDQVGGVNIELTSGMIYTVTVTGDARANPLPGGEFDGLFVYYYDGTDPNHPVTHFLPLNEPLAFVASEAPFYAFLVDKTLKDVADNSGNMVVTLTSARGAREELVIDAVFNCIGLEDFGAAKKILLPGTSYSMSVTGDAYTNADPTGYYDGVLIFTRDAAINVIHPILVHLDFGDEFVVTEMHATGWVYCFLVDESYGTMGNNGGKSVVAFEETTPVEDATWAAIKALYR